MSIGGVASHTLFHECIKRPKRSYYRKSMGDSRALRTQDNAFGGCLQLRVACFQRSNRCLMDGDAYPLYTILPQSRSIVFVVASSSPLYAHTDVPRGSIFQASRFSSFSASRSTKVTPRPQDSLLRARQFDPLRPRTRTWLTCCCGFHGS